MNTNSFINELAEALDTTKTDARFVYDVVLNLVEKNVIENGEFSFKHIGKLKVRDVQAQTYRNPQDGSPIEVGARKKVTFKMSKQLKDKLNS